MQKPQDDDAHILAFFEIMGDALAELSMYLTGSDEPATRLMAEEDSPYMDALYSFAEAAILVYDAYDTSEEPAQEAAPARVLKLVKNGKKKDE